MPRLSDLTKINSDDKTFTHHSWNHRLPDYFPHQKTRPRGTWYGTANDGGAKISKIRIIYIFYKTDLFHFSSLLLHFYLFLAAGRFFRLGETTNAAWLRRGATWRERDRFTCAWSLLRWSGSVADGWQGCGSVGETSRHVWRLW